MSVHVSLHSVIASSVESAKALESNSPGASFGQALNAASEVVHTHSFHDAGGHDGDKRQQRRQENAKDVSQAAASTQDVLSARPVLPAQTPQESVSAVSMPTQIGDQPIHETASETGNTISLSFPTANSLESGAANSAGLQPRHVAEPIISSLQPGTGLAAPTTGEDDASSAPVEDGSVLKSGAILAPGDEALSQFLGTTPDSFGLPNISTGTPPRSSVLGQDGTSSKDQSVVVQGDSAETAAPVIALPVVASPVQLVPMSAPTGLDIHTMIASAKPADSCTEGKDSASKQVSVASKDRASSDVHGRRKTNDFAADSQSSLSGVPSPQNLSVTGTATTGQENNGQKEANDFQTLQSAQVARFVSSSDVKTPQHSATTAPSADVPAPPVPTMTPAVADALATPALSGARLIQSVHQSEMKLGMNSAEFGNISISTSVTHQALSAQISLDHSELGRVLAAHLPAMEEKLSSAYGLQARVELSGSANGSYAGSSGHASEDRENHQGGSATFSRASSEMVPAITRSISFPALETSRLDIRI